MVGGGNNTLEWICAGDGEQKECRVDIMQVFFVWLSLIFVVFTSTILLIGWHEESLRKDINSNSAKNITKYVIGW